MRQFIDVTGKTEEGALSNALGELAWIGTMCPFEILERGQIRLFGPGQLPAKVRVS